jgi:hypothetical protein
MMRRDLLVAGLQSGSFDDVAESSALRRPSGELGATTLGTLRRVAGDRSGSPTD